MSVSSRMFSTLAMLLLATGCSDDGGTNGPPPGDIEAARQELEDVLFAALNADIGAPDEVDLREAKRLYEGVLAGSASPAEHSEAHLALSLLEIATLSTDSDVNAAFDDWEAYLDQFVPFESAAPTLVAPGPLGLPTRGDLFSVPVQAVLRSAVGAARMGFRGAVPQISTVQEILEHDVIPATSSAIDHLGEVLEDPAYEFVVTPKMQGDSLEIAVVADRTDFLAIRAVLRGLRAACRAAISYEVSMPQYDEKNICLALDQTTGTWLKLRPGQQEQMPKIPDDLLDAAEDLDAAIASLFAEIASGDNQDDEIIKIGPDIPSHEELEDFRTDELMRIMNCLTVPCTETQDWDSNSSTPDVALEIDLRGFFTDPVENFKTLMPPYSCSTEIVPFDESFHSTFDPRPTMVDVPMAGSYSGWCQENYNQFELSYADCSASAPWLQPELQSIVDTEVAAVMANPNWSGELYVYVSFFGDLTAGTQTIVVDTSVSYAETTSWIAIPLITFAANTYSEWAASWPDPTLGGLLVNPPSAPELLSIFGMREQDWGKVLRLDWHNGFELYDPPARAVATR